jgi:predicted nucleic acid-binding protein
MAGRIQRLSIHEVESNRKYFLDSNVWIFALSNILNPNPKESVYIDFIGKLLEKEQVIYSHTLVVAEVFNAIARINFKNFKKNLPFDPNNQLNSQQIDNLDFKKDYRGSEDYMYHLSQFKSEFEIYSKNIKLMDKEIDLDIAYLVKNVDGNSDFNDYFFYELAIDLGLTIVTDDRDFDYKGIDILTENQSLH